MKFSFSKELKKADTLLVLLSKSYEKSAHFKSLPSSVKKAIEVRAKAKDFAGEENEVIQLFDLDSFKKIVVLGYGDSKQTILGAEVGLGGTLNRFIKNASSATLVAPEEMTEGLLYGLILGHYQFKRYKKADPKKGAELESVHVVTSAKIDPKLAQELDVYQRTSSLLRDLVNTPTGDMNTEDLANEAAQLAKKAKLKITVLDEKKLASLGCGSLVGVGQGAKAGSKMVILEYKNSTKKTAQIAFIGKGIVFDTGGLNLKPSGYIETMKEDMTGAATVMATMQSIAELKLKGNFLGVLCLAENAVSDRSMHPGDVLKAYNGKTIEVTNTDGEGRLVLADGLAYVEKNYKPDRMIDVATLTGAVTVALGYQISGVLGNDEEWQNMVLETGKESLERYWPFPLDEDFVKACKGDFTDLKNSTDGVRAGTIMGAAFMKHFVEKTPWVHLDIAGTSWAERPTSTTAYGSTAASLRTLVRLAKKLGA